jgi:Tol biopolymer transport system component
MSEKGGSPDLYVKPATGVGSEELLQKGVAGPTDWSPDGKYVLYRTPAYDIWAIPMSGDRKPFPVLAEKFSENAAKFSPDGRWILYVSNETGRNEVYVQAFPPSGAKWQVSVNGSERAIWPRNGKEIIFASADGKIMAVDVKLGATFEAGIPHELFQIPGGGFVGNRFASSADGQRFLIPLSPQSGDRPNLTTILNWTADIKK